MSQKREYVNLTSPLVKARYPKLGQQDIYEGKEVGYKLGALAHDEVEFLKFKAQVEAGVQKLIEASGKKKPKFSPVKEDKDGNQYLEFKTYDKVPLFGPKGGMKLPEATLDKIGGGSILRIQVSLTVSNGGVVGYLNSIQLAKLVEKNGEGFDDIDGAEDLDIPAGEGFDDVEDNGLDI